MTGRKCAVIGGGAVAARRVAGLLFAGAAVTVISPILTNQLSEYVRTGAIKHKRRKYQPGDVAGYEFVFVATADAAVNAAVYEEGKGCGAWMNIADDPQHCDFILPAVLRRGDLVVSVATGGKSPAFSRRLRDELEHRLPANLEGFIDVVAEVRTELRQRSISPSYDTWQKALDGDVRAFIERGELIKAKDLLLKELGAERCN
jgi:precorrin-2 dehydrogenase/sirohydrochlorin ferrochelatase